MRALRQYRRFATYDYDLAVIGAGPGGYVAAIKGAQLGLRTACIEKRATLGGTCLNVGCIPAKALLNSSHKFYEAKHHFAEHGVHAENIRVDLKQLMANKLKAVAGLTKGVELLFKKNQVTWVKGEAAFRDTHTLEIDGGQSTLTANKFIIATGSEAAQLPGGFLRIDENRILSSEGALRLTEIPKKMLVVGGGVIGLELGSVWSRLGAEVTVLEFQPRILPGSDHEVAAALQKSLVKQGMKFHLGAKVIGAETSKKGVKLIIDKATPSSPDVPAVLEADYVLLSVGRKAFTGGLNLDAIDVTVDKHGRINISEHLQTLKHHHIYAIGDCVRGPMLAHKAEEEAIFAAELIAKKRVHINYDAIPSVVYTHPELASVGKTEEELKANNIPYSRGTFPFLANSRAKANSVIYM